VYLYLLVGLVLFALSVGVAYPGAKSLGWIGVSLFGVLFTATVSLGLTTKGPRRHQSLPSPHITSNPKQASDFPLKEVTASSSFSSSSPLEIQIPSIGPFRSTTFILVFLLELAGLIALLAVCGENAYVGRISSACGPGTPAMPWSTEFPVPMDIVRNAGGLGVVEVVISLPEGVGGALNGGLLTSTVVGDISATAEGLLLTTTVVVSAR